MFFSPIRIVEFLRLFPHRSWLIYIFLTLVSACNSFWDVHVDARNNASARLSEEARSGLLLIELRQGSNVFEVAGTLRIHGIRPLVMTADSHIIIEALNIDANVLPANSVVHPLPIPGGELPEDTDWGQRRSSGRRKLASLGNPRLQRRHRPNRGRTLGPREAVDGIQRLSERPLLFSCPVGQRGHSSLFSRKLRGHPGRTRRLGAGRNR